MPITADPADLYELTITVSVKQTSARGAVMYQTIGAVAATTLFATASIVLALVAVAPAVSAQSWMPMVVAAVRADSFDARYYGADCSQQSWPYIAAGCLHSTALPATKIQTVRVIAVDKTQR